MSKSELGRYTGRLVLLPWSDGRRMQVLEEFGFAQAGGLHWPVKPLCLVDGASIPRPLWSLIGGPWEGKYRDASVVHDYYCDVRTAAWRSVHRMFFDAMLTSDVSAFRAKLMYAAVYFAGPRWSETVEHNMGLGLPAKPSAQLPQERSSRGHAFSPSLDGLVGQSSELPASVSDPAVADAVSGKIVTLRDIIEAVRASVEAKPSLSDGPPVLNLERLATVLKEHDPDLWLIEAGLDAADFKGSLEVRQVSLGSLKAFD